MAWFIEVSYPTCMQRKHVLPKRETSPRFQIFERAIDTIFKLDFNLCRSIFGAQPYPTWTHYGTSFKQFALLKQLFSFLAHVVMAQELGPIGCTCSWPAAPHFCLHRQPYLPSSFPLEWASFASGIMQLLLGPFECWSPRTQIQLYLAPRLSHSRENLITYNTYSYFR